MLRELGAGRAHQPRGGPSALAAAICGRTAAYGLHRDEARRATHRVRVECPVREPWEFAALGYWVGRQVGNGIPYVEGLDLPLLWLPRRGPGGARRILRTMRSS